MGSDTIYTSLPLGRKGDEIRILELLPGAFDEDLCCELHVESVHAKFEALSYVWGNPNNTLPIDVRGRRMQVTRNLESALRHLRKQSEARRLWVDALCIDQSNHLERQYQVGLMGTIYESAECVVAWLGPVTDPKALLAIRHFGSRPDAHWDSKYYENVEQDMSVPAFELAYWLRNDWYQRIWTLQEEILAKSIVYVCGSFVLQSSEIDSLVMSFARHSTAQCCQMSRILPPFDLSTDISEPLERMLYTDAFRRRKPPFDFLSIASRFRLRRAMDPRDKIFGILGLTDDLSKDIINYESSVADIYTQAAFKLIENTGRLDVLSHVSPGSSLLAKSLPSWVPDWSDVKQGHTRCLSKRQEITNEFNSCHLNTPARPKKHSQNCLGLQGLLCDVISKVGAKNKLHSTGRAYSGVPQLWREMVNVDKEPERPYVAGSTILDAYWRTILMDIVPSGRDLTTGIARRADKKTRSGHDKWWWEYLQSYKYKDLISQQAVEKRGLRFDSRIAEVGGGRRLVFTSKGYLGMAPEDAEEGDEVWVLDGGRLPLVLRPLPKELHDISDAEYSLVGDAYVHGIMDGQFIEESMKRGVSPTPVAIR